MGIFGIPANNVFGARVDINDNKRIKTKFNEGPYDQGKVNVLKLVFTGGDANWDRFLLSYTSQNGIRLWTGKDSDYKELKEKYYFEEVQPLFVETNKKYLQK